LADASPDLGHEHTIGRDLERLLPAVKVVLADKNGRRPALPRDDDALVAALDLVDELAKLRLYLGERQRLHPN